LSLHRGSVVRVAGFLLNVMGLRSRPRENSSNVENMILLGSSDRVGIHDVPMEVRRQVSPPAASSFEQNLSNLSVHPNLKRSERAAIEAALAETGRNLTEAAKRLGIARSTLYRKLDEHGMARPAGD
jgi:sigma-54 dependent transcriptional regulator, acetoin dehydrogenase operon transcriptional activator AcoR